MDEPEPGPDGGPPTAEAAPPKDRIVQTRVPRDLETTLKREARRRRLTVSHLVRNVLEDAFQLVDGVVANVDELVQDSVELAQRVGSGARRVADGVAGAVREVARSEEEERGGPLDHVWAWNRVVLNRATDCSRCGVRLARGAEAHAGLSDDPTRPRAWLCSDCIDALAEADERRGDGT